MAKARFQPVFKTPTVAVSIDDGPVVWCKLEYLNPSGSTKDRIARWMLCDALERGLAKPGCCVVEASSGSTAIGLSVACAKEGMRFIAVMPEGVSRERVALIKAYGAEVVLTDKQAGVQGSMRAAAELAEQRGAWYARQFENPANIEAHRRETAAELLQDVPGGAVDAVVSGVGTGGTLVGLWEGCRDAGCAPMGVYARPVVDETGLIGCECLRDLECTGYSQKVPGVIEGMSCLYSSDRLPGCRTVEVNEADAVRMTRRLHHMGHPVGPSSGLNLVAAIRIAEELGEDKVVATTFPDRLERYLSTDLLADV